MREPAVQSLEKVSYASDPRSTHAPCCFADRRVRRITADVSNNRTHIFFLDGSLVGGTLACLGGGTPEAPRTSAPRSTAASRLSSPKQLMPVVSQRLPGSGRVFYQPATTVEPWVQRLCFVANP
jgi:hypothetical protein